MHAFVLVLLTHERSRPVKCTGACKLRYGAERLLYLLEEDSMGLLELDEFSMKI